jgi:5-methylcytosine-specific restriction endonuclease McrA
VSTGWKGGSTRAWRRTRALVLKRDGHRCQLKLEGCETVATHAHHTKGKAHGDDPRFLVAACAPCNLKIGDPTKADPDPIPWSGW